MFKKLLTYICMLFVAGVGFLGNFSERNNFIVFNTGVYAECNTGTDGNCDFQKTEKTQDADMQKMLNGLVSGLNIILDILTIIVTPAIILASWLMSPDWTSGDLFQIRPMLHSLWVTVANITYFIYAVLLIFIALGTIFNSDKYGYKQLLPRLALGILLVPLTWWFIQFIISLSTIVTASVINIPTEVVVNYNQGDSSSWWTEPSIPKEIKYNNTDKKEAQKICAGSKNDDSAQDPGVSKTQECISPKDFIQKAGGMYSGLMIYSFAVFKFQEVKNITSGKDVVIGIGQIINQGIIGAVMFIVYGLLVIALIFMLMMRAIKLWFYAIFSPLMTLKYVIGDGFFGGKENSDTFEIKEFIGLAFVPALVGLALSFGLIIVSVMLKPPATTTKDCSETKCTITLFGNSDNNITTEVKDNKTTTTASVGGASVVFTGDVTSGSSTSGVKSALNKAGGIIGTIIINIIALVFIWVAFMAAKNVSKAVKAAVSPFEELGGKIGKLGMSLPKYAPILPGGLSISGANKLAEKGSYMIDQAHDKKIAESQLGKIMGYGDAVGAADKKRMDEYTKAGLKNADAMKGAVQLMQQNATKTNFDTDPMAKGFMDTLKKEFGSQIEIESQLKHAGVDERNAKIIAEAAIKEKTDLRLNKDLLGAWKDIAKSGINSSATKDSSTIIQASQFNKDTKSMAVDISGIAFTIKDGKVSDADIKRLEEGIRTIPSNEKDFVKVLTNKLIFSGLDSSQADLVGKQLADKLKNKFGDVKKEEPKKS